MELRQLEHFVAVAAELSFTKAAKRVHVVQSALSTSVAKLEHELDVTLFDRTRQQITLTAAGDRFLTHAHAVIRAARSATDSVGEYRGNLSGSVEFGSLISYGPMNVARALGDFHRAHPFVQLKLRLSQSGASAYLPALVEGSLDLALVSVPQRFPPQLDMRLLFEEPMVFVCRGDHRLAGRHDITPADLADEDLIGFPPEFGLRRLMDDSFARAGVEHRPLYEVPAGFASVADLVSHGLGTAFMPRSEARKARSLTHIPLADPVSWQVYLASRPESATSEAATRLARILLKEATRSGTG